MSSHISSTRMYYSLNVNGLEAQNQTLEWNDGNRIIIHIVYIAVSWNGTETQLEIMMCIECSNSLKSHCTIVYVSWKGMVLQFTSVMLYPKST